MASASRATSNRNRRVVKEIQDVRTDTTSGVSLEPLTDIQTERRGTNKKTGEDPEIEDLTHFLGIFTGPPDTPYEGGTYVIDIKIPAEYPFQPPKMTFVTKIWHPNISSVTGAICLDTLASAWSPILTLKSVLISLQSLLASPEPRDPQDAEVANMLIRTPQEFARVAREWTVKHAGGSSSPSSSTSSGSQKRKSPEKDDNEDESQQRNVQQKIDSRGSTDRHTQVGNKAPSLASVSAQYKGYSRALVNKFTPMGFGVPQIVSALELAGVDKGHDVMIHGTDDEFIAEITNHLVE